ncbi:hypothetical protein MAP00_002163 [Monascus purpureus]|nr:hypothetical protein MAP00_002163 [Monascus purpureus]
MAVQRIDPDGDISIIDPEGDVMLLVMRDDDDEHENEKETECSSVHLPPLSPSSMEEEANIDAGHSSASELNLTPDEDQALSHNQDDGDEQSKTEEDDEEDTKLEKRRNPIQMKIQVSSKHLSLASGYFKARLKPVWPEGQTLEANKYVELPLHGCDPEALLILMQAIHARTRNVPGNVSLELLYELAKLADYFDCLEAVDFFASRWIESVSYTFVTDDMDRLMTWLFIYWAFRRRRGFEKAAHAVYMQSTGRIMELRFPDSDLLQFKIEHTRQIFIGNIIKSLYDQINSIIHCEEYSFESEPTVTGELLLELRYQKLYPHPAPPFTGLSLASLERAVRGLVNARHVFYGSGHFPLIPRAVEGELLRQLHDAAHAVDYTEYFPGDRPCRKSTGKPE